MHITLMCCSVKGQANNIISTSGSSSSSVFRTELNKKISVAATKTAFEQNRYGSVVNCRLYRNQIRGFSSQKFIVYSYMQFFYSVMMTKLRSLIGSLFHVSLQIQGVQYIHDNTRRNQFNCGFPKVVDVPVLTQTTSVEHNLFYSIAHFSHF